MLWHVWNFFRNLFGKDNRKIGHVKDFSSDDDDDDENNTRNSYEDRNEELESQIKKFGSDSEHLENMKDLQIFELKFLGSGAFSIVKKGYSIKYQNDVAVKIILTEDEKNQSYIKKYLPVEIKLWSELSSERHDNILSMLQYFQCGKFLYVVMEVAQSGDLYERLLFGAIQEMKAKTLFKGLIAAVAYCHAKGIAHRDIKPQNLLLGKNDQVKLADFSFVTRDNPVSCERCGTPGMLAPEQRDCGYYDPFISDMWQTGLTLYFMLFKQTPYTSTRKKYLLAEISQMKNLYKHVPFPKNRMLSQNCKDAIAGMLEIEPENRWTVADVQKSFWLTS